MNALALVGLGLAATGLLAWVVREALTDFGSFVAPDTTDEREIRERYGDAPEAEEAIEHRFGPGSHWKDAATALGGLIGFLGLVWVVFG